MTEDILTLWNCSKRYVPPLDVAHGLGAAMGSLRIRMQRRLRKEVSTYAMIAVIWIVVSADRITLTRIIAMGIALILIGSLMRLLWWRARRLETAPLALSARQAVGYLRAELEATLRVYMIGYLVLIAVAVTVMEAAVIWKHGLGLISGVVILVGTLAIALSYLPGERYLQSTFGRYRTELSRIERELLNGSVWIDIRAQK